MDNRDRWHYSPQNRQQYPSPYPYQGKGGAPPPPPPEHYPRPEAPLGQLRLDGAYVPLDIMLTIPPYREDNSTRQYMFFLHNTVAVNVSLQVEKHRQQHTFLQCEHGYTAAFNAALDEVFRIRGYSFIKQCQFKKVPLLEQMRGKPLIGPVLIDKKWGKKNIEGNSVKQCSLEIGTIKVLDQNHSSKSRPKQTNQPHSKAIQMAKGNIVDSCTPEYVDSYHCYSSGENCGKGIFYYWNERKRLAEIKLMTTPIPAETYHHRIVSLERELISLQVQLQKQDEALDTIALSMTLGSGQTVLTINLLSLLTHDFMTTMNRTGLNSNVPFTYKPQLGSHVQDTDCVVTKCTDEIYKLISETFEAATDVPHPKRINATSYRNDLSRHLKPETLKAIIKQLILQNSVFDDVTPFVVQRSLRVFKTADDEGTSDEPNFSMSEIDSNVDLVEKYLSTQSKAKFSPGNMKMHRDGGHVEQGDLSYAQLDLSSTWNAVDQTLDDFEELKGRYPSSLCVTVVSAALLASQLKMTGNLPGVQTATKGIKSTFFGSTFQHLTKVSTTDGHNFLTHLLRTISMIEDQENSASCVSATIKFDLLNEDYSNWSREKINEASTIVDEWIQRRAYMSDVLASNLDKLSRHLEDLQHEYVTTTDSRTKDRYADVNWKSVQNRLLSANHDLIKHLQSAGQTFLGHASSEYLETKWKQASDCRRKKDELQSIHARSLTDLTSEMESDTTQGENDLGEGTTSTSSTQDEENEQKSPIINAWHSQTNEQQADINREAYDYGLSCSYGRYACQFSSMQVLRTLETMIRSIMWNWSNSSFANINVGNLARTTDRTYDPVVTFANSQARDEIRRLLDMYMSCHKDYAALLERSHKSKHYPRSTVGEARGCYQQESRREDNHRYPRALNDGHALGAHEGSLRTFVYNLADDFARKVLLQTEGHNVKVITDPRPFGLLKDRTQLHCGSKSNQFVTSTIVQGSTVYVKISDHTEIHMVKQLGNEKFYVPEKVLDPFRYVKTYYVLPGVGRDHKDNDFCGKVNGFLAQRKQHELAERVMFSPAWRETSINEVMGHPMLPSALALTNGELCNKLVRGVHSFVTDTGPWETMFRLGFPRDKKDDVVLRHAWDIPESQTYYPSSFSAHFLTQSRDAEGKFYSPVAPAPFELQLNDVPTSIHISMMEVIKENRARLPEIASSRELEQKMELQKQRMTILHKDQALEHSKEELLKAQERKAEKEQQETQKISNVAVSISDHALPSCDVYEANLHRIMRKPKSPELETIEVAVVKGEHPTKVSIQLRTVNYSIPAKSLTTSHSEQHVGNLTGDERSINSKSIPRQHKSFVIDAINSRNQHEARYFGSTTCVKCGFFVPKVSISKQQVQTVNELGGCTKIMKSNQEGAPIVYQHDCIPATQKKESLYAQQVLSFRHQAICRFGREGINACFCGNFHDENKLSVVQNKTVVLEEGITDLAPGEKEQVLRGLLVLYCSAAKMFYPICLDKALERKIKLYLLESENRISYLLFQTNMEGPDKAYTHFYDSPGNFSGDTTCLPFCTTCFKSGHTHGCVLDLKRADTEKMSSEDKIQQLRELLCKFTYKPEKLGPDMNSFGASDERSRKYQRGADSASGSHNTSRAHSMAGGMSPRRDYHHGMDRRSGNRRPRTTNQWRGHGGRQDQSFSGRPHSSSYDGHHPQGMTLREYTSKWGDCSLPIILEMMFDQPGWIDNYNHKQLLEQLKLGNNESGWSMYTVYLRSTLPYDRGPPPHTDNTSHIFQHTQEGLHLAPEVTATAVVTTDETDNSTVSPIGSTARTKPIRLCTLRQRLRRTIIKYRKRVMHELRSITRTIRSTSTNDIISGPTENTLRSQLLSETIEPKLVVHRRATPKRMLEYATWVAEYNETHYLEIDQTDDQTEPEEWEFDESPFAQLNRDWMNEVQRSFERPRTVHVNSLHESRIQVGSMHLSSVPMQPHEIGRLSQMHQRRQLLQTNRNEKFRPVHRRTNRPIGGARGGLAWPTMRTRCITDDGSLMLVLDSGAEANVLNELALIPNPTNHPMKLISFNGHSTTCPHTGECVVGAKDHKGDMVALNLGWSGYREASRSQDNLLSVPVLRNLGWQFWFGDHPYAVDPAGQEILLYSNHRGYLALRVHTVESARINATEYFCDEPRQIGYLSNDWDLWHGRMVHQGDAVLNHMMTHDQASGIPQLKHYTPKGSKCISCEIGKSTMKHVGDVRYTDKVKMNKATADKALEEDIKYYPLQQVHLDCCDMCTPDIHGNNQFLIIVDRATKYVWLRPFDNREDGAIVDIVEEWITDVVRPYHAHRINHKILEDDALTTLKYRYKETDKRKRLKLLISDTDPMVRDILAGLKMIRTDSGTEFLNNKMKLMLAKHKITHRTTAREVKDATAESHIRRVTSLTRTCLIAAGLKKCFWSGIADMVVHTLNRSHNASINGVPYSEMFGLKPNLSYLRQPGCVALCHRMDQQRKIKADERAFIGILVGYDTTSRSWLFFNPATGREVRTIHATFHERPREAHEHVDMDHMLLSEPTWNGVMKEHGWRCQLWPDVLWPGMRSDKLGSTKEDFPPAYYTLTGLNPERVTFDEASRPEATTSEESSSDDDELISDASEQSEESDDDELLSPSPSDLPHKNQGINSGGGNVEDIFSPTNIILRGTARSTKEYMRSRVDQISGNRVQDIFDTTKSKSSPNFPMTTVPIDNEGNLGMYRTRDFQYDIDMDFITLEQGAREEQSNTGDYESEEEKQDVPEHSAELVTSPAPKRVLRRSSRRRGTKRVQRILHVGDKSVEVDFNYNAHEFDKFLGMKPIHRDEHKCTQMVTQETVWKQSSTPLRLKVANINMICGNSYSKLNIPEHDSKWRGFLDPKKPLYTKDVNGLIIEHEGTWPDSFINESRIADEHGTVYGSFPTKEELDGYRGNGLYADSEGVIKPSSIVRTVQQMYSESTRYVYNLGKRAVLGVPSPSELNNPNPGEEWFEHEVQAHTVVNEKGDEETIELKVPKGSRQAFQHEYQPHWPNAIYKELIGLYNYGCFELEHADHPEVYQHGTLPSHIVFTDKWTADVPEQFIKCKARLVAGGNFEPAPENAFENFSPTAGAIINRFFDAYCVYKGFKIYSTDCTQAFLNAPVFKPIFIRPPPGCCPRGYVWRLKKHLYGLCSSPAAWMNTLSEQLVKQGFKPFENDPCLMRKVDESNGDEVIISIFVDDIKWAGTNQKSIEKEIAELHAKYKMTPTSEVDTYLGMQYIYDTDVEGKFELHVNQTAYIRTLVKRFEMEDQSYFKKKHTPLPEFRSEEDLKGRYKTFFKNMKSDAVIALQQWSKKFSFPMIIGSLIHAMVHTRPDISYAVSTLSRSMANPELYHFKAAQHTLTYLRDTDEIDLVYKQEIMLAQVELVTAQTDESYTSESGKSVFDQFLRAAVDASFADCDKTYRSTSGFVLWFGGTAIDWECKRQPLVTLSTMESEFVAASKLVCSIRFIHKLLAFVGLRRSGPTECHEDNAACIAVSMKPVHKQRSKHIGVKYMNVREATENGEIKLVSVKSQHQCADIFTKSLTRDKFERFRDTIRGSVTYKDMVTQEIAASERLAKIKDAKSKAKTSSESKSINLVSIQTVIQKIEEFELTEVQDWTTYTIASNHYSMIDLSGKINPLQSLQECIEGKATYIIPGYP